MKENRNLKRIVLLCLTAAMVLVLSTAVLAASAPAKVKTLKASSGESQVTLKWTKVSGATGYYVYYQTGTGKLKKAATVKSSKKTYTVKKLKNGTEYKFYISAYKKAGSKKLEGEKTGPVTATPKVKNPGRVTVNVYANGDTRVVLAWKKLKKASKYEVFQQNTEGKFIKIGTTKNNSITVSKLIEGKTYYFKVRAVRTVSGKSAYGSYSKVVAGKPQKLKVDLSVVHKIWYKARITNVGKSITLTSNDKKKKKKVLQSGTSVVVSDYVSGGTSTLKVGNYFYKIPTKYLSSPYGYSYDGSKAYNKATAEAYVNYKGYKSASKYFIWVNTYNQRMYVFRGSQYNWKLIYTWKCSTGQWGFETPFGFTTMGGRDYRWWFGDYQFAYFASHIRGGAIHSELYYPNGVQKYSGVGELGNPASHGCIRVEKSNAEWIFYNCAPTHTELLVF